MCVLYPAGRAVDYEGKCSGLGSGRTPAHPQTQCDLMMEHSQETGQTCTQTTHHTKIQTHKITVMIRNFTNNAKIGFRPMVTSMTVLTGYWA